MVILGCDGVTNETTGQKGLGLRTLDAGRRHGFTLIELLVVMAVIALLLTIALPRYMHSTDRAKEAVLKENLVQMRHAIDQYYADRGRYPARLEDLVEHKYLRRVPLDPITESTGTWLVVPPREPDETGVFDVRSGASGTAMDGTAYGDW
jgi:general secretion pathway protein G